MSSNKKCEEETMSKVMIHPADYDNALLSVDRAFELFPIGELKPLLDFKLPPLGGEALLHNDGMQQMIHSKTILRPQADRELCTACNTCVEQCPVDALTMIDELPEVDVEKCITCFCCQEICPEKAIVLR